MKELSQRRVQSTAALAGAALGLVIASALASIMVAGSEPPDSSWSLMLVASFAAPYALALVAAFVPSRLTRSTLLSGAVTAAVLSAMTPFSVATLPFIVAAGFVVGAAFGAVRGLSLTADVPLRLIAAVAGGVAIYASIWLLFVSEDPRCVRSTTATSCTSDAVTATEAAASLTVLLAALAVIVAASLIRLRAGRNAATVIDAQ